MANEVETEQIANDSSVSHLTKGNVTSFVQLRGSVPAHWAQDVSKMVPKPPIFRELSDPNACTAGKENVVLCDESQAKGNPCLNQGRANFLVQGPQ